MTSDLKIFFTKNKLDVLNDLSTEEKSILREYILRQTEIIKFLPDSPAVQKLLQSKVLMLYNPLFRRFNYSNKYYPYRINKYIKGALIPEKHLGISSTPTTRELEKYADQRPNCIKYVKKFL